MKATAAPGARVLTGYDTTPDLDRDRSKILFVDTGFVTVPLTEEANRAIYDFIRAHVVELDAALAPHGLKACDVVLPEFERAVYRSEVE